MPTTDMICLPLIGQRPGCEHHDHVPGLTTPDLPTQAEHAALGCAAMVPVEDTTWSQRVRSYVCANCGARLA